MKSPASLLLVAFLSLPWADGSPRRATAEALEDWGEGRYEEARARLDAVLARRPDSPIAQRNAGSGRLAAGDAEDALMPLLAATGAPEAAPDAFYDLGNARRALDDPEAAVEAYRQALLRDPGHEDAKHNLELVLRELQEQQQQQQQQQQQAADSRRGEEGQSESPRPDSPASEGEEASEEQASRDSAEQGEESATGSPSEGAPSGPPRTSRLPSFQDQEDMSAEEAAALLEAVEDLEREQRREMLEAIRAERTSRLSQEKDW